MINSKINVYNVIKDLLLILMVNVIKLKFMIVMILDTFKVIVIIIFNYKIVLMVLDVPNVGKIRFLHFLKIHSKFVLKIMIFLSQMKY